MKHVFTAPQPNEGKTSENEKTDSSREILDHGPFETRPLSQFWRWLPDWGAIGRCEPGSQPYIRFQQPRTGGTGGIAQRERARFQPLMFARAGLLAAAGAFALGGCAVASAATEKVVQAPVAQVQAEEPDRLRVAIFAGGCFWGVEGVFSHVKGVKAAVSGYHGGRAASATYRQVVTGFTDHAEAVRIVYDPNVVRYDELLQILFSVVTDPTLLNRQGPDVGVHYRSAIVPMNKEQARVARAYLEQLDQANVWGAPVVTTIEPYKAFYEAEGYHQDFMLKNPEHGYIVRWDKPKVEALQKLFPEYYRSSFLRDHVGN